MSATVTGLYVGTSGFSYPSWRPGFYPAGTRPPGFLRHYASRLPAVELNNPFYKLPSQEQFERWGAETPPGFRFAVKMSRPITHFGRLELVPDFCERARALDERLGPVLVQLPPNRPRDDGLLALLRGSLDPELRYAFELRHPSWEDADLGGAVRVNDLEATGPFRYLRMREPPYGEAALRRWAERLRPLLADGIEVWCFFKHEDEPTAPRYAERLAGLLSRSPARSGAPPRPS